MDDIASTTSLVNVLPTPDDPINTVGLMAWKKKRGKYKDEYRDHQVWRFEQSLHLDSIY